MLFKINHHNKSLVAFYDSLVWEKEGTKLTISQSKRLGDFYWCKNQFYRICLTVWKQYQRILLEICLKRKSIFGSFLAYETQWKSRKNVISHLIVGWVKQKRKTIKNSIITPQWAESSLLRKVNTWLSICSLKRDSPPPPPIQGCEVVGSY